MNEMYEDDDDESGSDESDLEASESENQAPSNLDSDSQINKYLLEYGQFEMPTESIDFIRAYYGPNLESESEEEFDVSLDEEDEGLYTEVEKENSLSKNRNNDKDISLRGNKDEDDDGCNITEVSEEEDNNDNNDDVVSEKENNNDKSSAIVNKDEDSNSFDIVKVSEEKEKLNEEEDNNYDIYVVTNEEEDNNDNIYVNANEEEDNNDNIHANVNEEEDNNDKIHANVNKEEDNNDNNYVVTNKEEDNNDNNHVVTNEEEDNNDNNYVLTNEEEDNNDNNYVVTNEEKDNNDNNYVVTNKEEDNNDNIHDHANEEEDNNNNNYANENEDENLAECHNNEDELFIQNGCGCVAECHLKFSRQEILKCRNQVANLSERCNYHISHKHVFLMGLLNAVSRMGPLTSSKGRKPMPRKYTKSEYMFRGMKVCQNFFQFVNCCKRDQLKGLRKTLSTDSVIPTIHKNVVKTSQVRSLPLETRLEVRTFVRNYADRNELVLPGRIPSHKNLKLIVLPCSMKNSYIYKEYVAACAEGGKEPVKLRMWYNIWKEQCANVVIQKPRSDLCPTCKENETSLGKMTRLTLEDQESLILKSTEHLKRVKEDRKYYNDLILESRQSLQAIRPNITTGRHNPNSLPTMVHYSFDFAQQVHLPSSPDQVGPLYFLTGYKVALFGVAIELLGKFVLYLIPESCNTGKGANIVISLLHHFFENFAVREEIVHCHADNCTGQNKNNYLMQYLIWRVLKGLHKKVNLSFLPVGHTKFAPDLYFGLFKRNFNTQEVHSLNDVIHAARTATSNKAIEAVVVETESGTCAVNTYDWKSYFKTFTPASIPNLLKMYHFSTNEDVLGSIQIKMALEDEFLDPIEVFSSQALVSDSFPDVVIPIGLSLERIKYLYKKIRPFVKFTSRNILCPMPVEASSKLGQERDNPKTTSKKVTVSAIATNKLSEVSGKKQISSKLRVNRCGNCSKEGHTNRVRPDGSFVCPDRL